ncbi:MAG: hydrogenase iron-sulfur subunit [Chloroflexota bacterium]|nr:hydrogenase iron-sulfur subunit [Chloroflexota bacterium]
MNKSAVDIIVFTCNWDGLSCIEAAAQAGLQYPSSVKVVRVSCLSRLHQGLILRAFDLGADGVMLLGCEPGKCQFDADSNLVAQECEKARKVLRLLGIEERRLILDLTPPGDGRGFIQRVTNLIKEIEQLQIAIPTEA